MSFRVSSGVVAVLLWFAVPVSAQSVRISFDDGMVTLSAQNAPVRMILAEWARLGGTQIINGERIPGAPVTLELAGVPERQALEVLLRGASGYVIGARRDGDGGSSFDRIFILPTASAVTQTAPQPVLAQPPPPPPLPDFDDFPPVNDPELQRFRTPRDFVPDDGMPRQPDPDEVPAPATQPGQPGFPATVPGGATRPGVIIPVPQQQPQIDDDP